jgi:hypothetical protein
MFCRICGKELNEQAFACPGCGCLVGAAPKKPKKTTEKRENKGGLFKLFLILSVSCLAISLLFTIGSVIFAEPSVWSGYYSTNVYMRTGVLAIPAFATGVCGLGFGVTTFILGLKQKDASLKMMAIVNFIFSVTIFVAGVLAFSNCYAL